MQKEWVKWRKQKPSLWLCIMLFHCSNAWINGTSCYLHLLFPPQSFHSHSDCPDVYIGPDVGIRGLPVPGGRHRYRLYLHHPQQPAGGAGIRHALPSLQAGKYLSGGQRLWERVIGHYAGLTAVRVSPLGSFVPLSGTRWVRPFPLLYLHDPEKEILRLQQYESVQ